MYRRSEFVLFVVLTWASTLAVAAAVVAISAFLLFSGPPFCRYLALAAIVLSAFFRLQVVMYKQLVMERRFLTLIGPTLQHFRMAAKSAHFELLSYFILFWVALIGLLITFGL